jgi:hypothetical protein
MLREQLNSNLTEFAPDARPGAEEDATAIQRAVYNRDTRCGDLASGSGRNRVDIQGREIVDFQ